jgi:hypothetical protein
MQTSQFPRGALAIALVLGIAILGAGYFIGAGPAKFKTATRTVTVKGLADREVISDYVIWTLYLRRAGSNFAPLQTEIRKDRDRLVEFLVKQGIADAEIERVPISSSDKQATDVAIVTPTRDTGSRYVVNTTLIVRTPKVDIVRTALGNLDELLMAGLAARGRDDGSNVVYRFTKFNELRPALIAEATRNARASADSFAADSDMKVGPIRSANQGLIQIFGETGQDESAGYVATSYRKKVRVVNTIEFDLVK